MTWRPSDQMVKINGRLGSLHFAMETRVKGNPRACGNPDVGTVRSQPRSLSHRADKSDGDFSVMGPGGYGGVGASLGAVAVTLVVAIIVLAIVSIGGGLAHPLVNHEPAVMAAAAAPPPVQS